MLNPAWRPAQADNPALAVIQQHYKINSDSTMESPVKAINLPVICAATPDQSADEIRYLASALERQLNLPDSRQLQPASHWSLSTGATETSLNDDQPEQVLILVDASLDALKRAYARIKPLQHFRDTRFHVIVHGAKDAESSRRYYRRLAMGTLRFLDLPLVYCGAAPERGNGFSQGIANLAQKVKQSSTDTSDCREIQ